MSMSEILGGAVLLLFLLPTLAYFITKAVVVGYDAAKHNVKHSSNNRKKGN